MLGIHTQWKHPEKKMNDQPTLPPTNEWKKEDMINNKTALVKRKTKR